MWLLGSSGHSAQLAARHGLPFALAAHFNPRDVVAALRPYRERFTPSETLAEPYALASFTVAASDDEREARRQAGTLAHAMHRMFQRKSYLLPSPEAVDAYTYDHQERQAVDSWCRVPRRCLLSGPGLGACPDRRTRSGTTAPRVQEERPRLVRGHMSDTVQVIVGQLSRQQISPPTMHELVSVVP
ncbi:LLM class flavin-dependent oxidoreductase [Streptomyces sp. NPDC003006]